MSREAEILSAARQLLNESGAGAVSVRAVAARANVGASTLRYYFPSQKALFDALVDQLLAAQLDDRRIHETGIPAVDRVAECVGQFLPTHHADLTGWLQMYANADGPSATDQGRTLLESLARSARTRIERWLSILDREAALRPGSVADHATVILTIIDGLCVQMLTPGSRVTSQSAPVTLRRMLKTVIDETTS